MEGIGERRLGTGINAPVTGWADVDRQVAQLREGYARAETPEQLRQIGLLCRDIFTSFGHVIFDPDKHLPPGIAMPKRDDTKTRLDLAIGAEYVGAEHEELRALVKATWRFVQPRVRDQTEDPTNAMVAADATIHLVNVLTALFPTPTGTAHAGVDEAGGVDSDEDEWAPAPEDLAYFMDWTAEDDTAYP